jgi:hypothetical protein
LSGKKLTMDTSPAARKLLLKHVNDNVFKNIDKFSFKLFDEDHKYRKQKLEEHEKR